MATSPNYGWEEPDDTDLVKDGALAIRTLGNAIDASMNAALGTKPAMGVLLNTTTVTASTGATISNVFSSTYDFYKIVVNGNAASGQMDLFYQNTLAGTPAAGASTYKYGSFYQAQASNAFGTNFYSAGNTQAVIGQLTAGNYDLWAFDIANPATTKFTIGAGIGSYGSAGTATFAAFTHSVNTAYDGCKIFCSSNWTGTIKIYGYRNS